MESNSLCNSLLKWLETFPGREGTSVPQLTDGVVMATVLHQIAPEYFSQFWLAKIKEDVGDNWRLKVSNLRKVLQGIVDYFQEQLNQNIKHFPLPDLNKIGEHNDEVELGRMLQLILGCAVNCESKQQYIEAIMNMEERVQKVIMEAIQELMLRESSPGILGPDGDPRTELGPASFHPHIKTVLEQLEAATQTRDEMMQRCLELEQQLSVLNEEKSTLSAENEKLLNRLDALETGGDLGTSTLRYKDLKKQIDGLQDELYKLETSRDEYRTKADVLERENQEIQARNEELQQLADEARSLKDEVDALREMSERAVVYEGTMETYKKKLEELSDLKRQVRILEEKNSDYMQHNMELEEEVKKSGTWRPQLDLYKKQVAELHQKLADEAKKTDRQIFENKKLAEKMEAITQEKDRLTMERDQLKESLEELRCHISTLTSPDTTSRPPSDLSDVDLLEVIPHDIRQKLIRLQHENSMLKQRAAEGDSSEQLPVLQTLVSDLQERQNSLTQENRWDSKGEINQNLPIHRPGSTTPPSNSTFSLLDAYFSVDPNRKMKLFKRNLKWASESDLLILRQPKGLVPANFLSSTLPLKQPRSLPPLTVPSFTSFATQTSKESPIVIRHIHEFKMSPSPTNEDSGCCRTSPSSCEGCEDSGCTGGHSPDYSGTLDSGVSGIYCGTLESGVSGVFRCLSPVIPSIVEECTTHHVSDILPALGGQRLSSPGVMHHSHPAHTSCMHCCSPHASHGEDNGEVSGRENGRVCCISPLPPPRPHTVCSYSSPYHYQNPSSPTPPSLLPTLPGSPPLSPLPTCSPLTLITSSFCTASTETSQQNVVSGLSYKPAKEGVIHSFTLSTSPTPVSSYSNPGPFPVSSPQGRRSSSGFSRTSLPPESPTPHNSPRLPNSINATRSRANKTSLITTALADQNVSLLDVPVAQSVLVGRASAQEKGQKSPERNVHQDKNDKQLEDEPLFRETDKHCSDNHRNAEEISFQCSSDSSESSTKHKKSQKESCPVTTTKKNYQLPEKKNSIPRGKILDSPSRLKSTVPANDIKEQEDIVDKSITRSPKPSLAQEKKPQANSGVGSLPVTKLNTDKTVLRNLPKEVKVPVSAERKSSPYVNKSRVPTSVGTSNKGSQSPKVSLNSRNNSPGVSKENAADPVPSSKVNNHVKFREPIVSQVNQNEHPANMKNYSPMSPRERMSSPPKSTVLAANQSKAAVPVTSKARTPVPVVGQARSVPVTSQPSRSNSTSKEKKNPPVKLLSDTLFTRFVVSPEYEKMLSKERFTSDTDTDLDTLERKLTFGMYDAPLVSSESCTSISPDDADEDPSATEYYTDAEAGEYNPNQYKANIDDNKNLNKLVSDNHQTAANEVEDEDEAASLVRTYSFFRKQSKLKKQRKPQSKEVPAPLTGGVVKPKNRTAKHVVAETFNAMFTLCTP